MAETVGLPAQWTLVVPSPLSLAGTPHLVNGMSGILSSGTGLPQQLFYTSYV